MSRVALAPRLLDWLLRRLLPGPPIGPSILHDLHEEAAQRAIVRGRGRMRLWYLRQTTSLALHFAILDRLFPRRREPLGIPELKGKTMDALTQDIRFGLRTLQRYPAVTIGVLIILTLGIGATTAIFSVVDAALLRPLPYPDENRLVAVRHMDAESGPMDGLFSPPDFEDLAPGLDSFGALAAYLFDGQSLMALTGQGVPEMIAGAMVTADFFATLGVDASPGRTFAPDELVPGQDRVVVISHRSWQARFGGRPDIVGQTMTLDGTPMTVIGVMPPRVTFPSEDVELWLPISLVTEDMIPRLRHVRWMQAIGRLDAGVSYGAASNELGAALAGLATTYPDTNTGWETSRLSPLRDELVGEARPALLLLFAATGLILLIVCTNVGSLLLTQATARSREVAIRTSVGAAPGRIVRQMLTESLILGLLGGALRLALAWLSLRLVTASGVASALQPTALTTNWRLAGFALGASVLTGALFGLMPAVRAWRFRASEELGSRGAGASRATARVRNGLVVAQIAIALTLVVGAGLAVRSFSRLLDVAPGFDAANVWVIGMRVPSQMEPRQIVAYRKEMLEAVRQVPGVVSVGGSKNSPLAAGGEGYTFTKQNADGSETRVHPESGTYIVMRGFFETLGVTFVHGRPFEQQDPVTRVVVNRSLAEQFWPGQNPVGETLAINSTPLEVLGVVEDLHHDGLATETRSALYVLADAFPRSSLFLYAKLTPGATGTIDGIRQTIREVNPDQAITTLATLDEVVAEHVGQPRLLARMVTLFASLALLLAALGVYGVMSYTVQAQRGEFGVRLALGASRTHVLSGVLRRSLRVAVVGVSLGSLASWWLSRFMTGVLYGVSASDFQTLGVSIGVVALAALAASTLPAVRATRIDPAVALRSD